MDILPLRESFHSFLRASNHQMPAGYSPDLVTIQLSNCLVTCHNTKKSNLKEKCRTSGISIQPYESRVQAIIILVHTIPLYQTIWQCYLLAALGSSSPLAWIALCLDPAPHHHAKHKRLRWHASRSKEIPACSFLFFSIPLPSPFFL